MRVRWTAAARQDRLEIHDYIAADNRRAAVRMDTLFSEAARNLSEHPLLGRTGQLPDTRELVVHKRFRLVYEIDSATVWVLALVHTARQWPPEHHDPHSGH